MNKKILLAVALIVAALVLGERFLASDAPMSLPTPQTAHDCSSSRSQLDVPYSTFWGWDESERSDFIYFDREKWEFVVCLEKRTLTISLEKPQTVDLEYTEVSITEKHLEHADEGSRSSAPYLDDLNGDGKLEFIGQIGHCVEGPCMGSSYVFQIDGEQILQLGSIDSWTVTPITENGRRALMASKQCFDYDFVTAFTHFSIIEFTPGGLVAVPDNRIRITYPETLRASLTEETNALEKLVNDAYRGADIRDLEAAYASLIKQNPEASNVHCDPLDIIRSIAGDAGA